MKEYIDIVDEIITEAYTKGHAEPAFDVWLNPNIKNKLDMYGHENALGWYFLNQSGEEYARKGCSKGISKQLDMEKRIQALELEIQSFTKKKQKRLYIYTTITFMLSLLACVKDYIPLIVKELSKIISLILN